MKILITLGNTITSQAQGNKLFELTNTDNGKTTINTYKECVEMFGENEFNEILLGYSPNWVAVEIERIP